MMDTPLILRYQWNWECLFRKLTWTENLLLSFSAKLFNVFNNTFGDMSHPCSCFWVPTLSVTEIFVCVHPCVYIVNHFSYEFMYFSHCLYLVTLFASLFLLSVHILMSLFHGQVWFPSGTTLLCLHAVLGYINLHILDVPYFDMSLSLVYYLKKLISRDSCVFGGSICSLWN